MKSLTIIFNVYMNCCISIVFIVIISVVSYIIFQHLCNFISDLFLVKYLYQCIINNFVLAFYSMLKNYILSYVLYLLYFWKLILFCITNDFLLTQLIIYNAQQFDYSLFVSAFYFCADYNYVSLMRLLINPWI